MSELAADFDLDRSFIYLNSGTLSISPRPVFEAFVRHAKDYERNPTGSLIESWHRLWEVQKELAAFFHARPEDLFLHHNVTEALNEFVLGVPLAVGNGGEIVVTDLEYGAVVNLCRFRAERSGLSLRTIALPSEPVDLVSLTPGEVVRRIVAQLRPETRLLLVSHVMTGTGLVIPLRELARETRARGVVLVVDGAHGPGALPLDFRTLDDLDFYGGNLHKWMMGPKGTGFGWVPARWQESLTPSHAGWTTYDTPPGFAAFGDGNPFTTRFLRSSCHQFAPFFAIHELLRFWRSHGVDNLFAWRGALAASLEAKMVATGWELLSPRGPLLPYRLPKHLEERGYGLMRDLLLQHKLQISTPQVKGRSCLRLSPHVYNSEAELERAVQILTGQNSLP